MTTESPPFSTRARISLMLAIIAFVVGIDQWSKLYARTHWQGNPPLIYLNDLFRIQYAENPGAFLSLLANMPEVRFWVLTVLNSFMLVFVTWCVVNGHRLSRLMFFAWTLILAGGIGNLIDRLRFGVVIDFMNMGIGGLRTGIFNVADMAITAGFLLFLPLLFRREEPAEEQPAVSGLNPAP